MSYVKHGHSPKSAPSGTYKTWRAMLDRCRRPAHKSYSRYEKKTAA